MNGAPLIGIKPSLTGRFNYNDRQLNVKKWNVDTKLGSVESPNSLNFPTNYIPSHIKTEGSA